jgi:hypothetical protein
VKEINFNENWYIHIAVGYHPASMFSVPRHYRRYSILGYTVNTSFQSRVLKFCMQVHQAIILFAGL